MHEMALAHSIVEIAEAQRAEQAFTRVLEIRLAIGALAHVDPRALAFGFEAASAGTVAAGAKLTIETTAARALCVPCGDTVTIQARGEACPTCGGYQLLLTEGEEMRVTEMEVE